jgi:hypothetical protein
MNPASNAKAAVPLIATTHLTTDDPLTGFNGIVGKVAK